MMDTLQSFGESVWDGLVWLFWVLPCTVITTIYTSAVNGAIIFVSLRRSDDTEKVIGDRNKYTALDVSFAVFWGVLAVSIILALGMIYIWLVVAGIAFGLLLYILIWGYGYVTSHDWRDAARGDGLWR